MPSFLSVCANVVKTLVLLGLALFLLLALLSYDPADPSFNRAADNPPANAMGTAGAYMADPLLQYFGRAFYVVPFVLAMLGIRLHFAERPRFPTLRLFLLALALPVFCLFLSGFPPSEEWPFYVGYGGIAGDVLSRFVSALPVPGAVVSVVLMPFAVVACWMAAGFPLSESGSIVTVPFRAGRFCYRLLSGTASLSAKLAESLPWRKRERNGEEPEDGHESRTEVDFSEDEEEEREARGAKDRRKQRQAKKKTKKPSPQERLAFSKKRPEEMALPNMSLLANGAAKRKASVLPKDALEQNARLLAQVLEDFGIYGKILKARPGPVVTLYELEPSPGTKSSRVIGLADDIARSMSALSARISVVPGRNILGIELPNAERETVYLKEILETETYESDKVKLPLALGKDIGGSPIVTDLSRMPHLLVAGTTGSGKSVAVNAMILSLLYRLRPDECKFIMIDPKMLELSVYEGIPHLLSPVVTEPAKAVTALKWAVREMENRYRLMSNLGVRNIAGYNKRIEEAIRDNEDLARKVQTGFDPDTGKPVYEESPIEKKTFPFIVVIVDEMADLMLTAGKEIEGSIQRLAQMARAAGIHLIMATQRPSVDVITGVIKANFPTRISFQVTSRIDSRTILGEMGAEQLLGMGDMLYMAGGGRVTRVHGPFVDDDEVTKVVDFLRSQGEPEYVDDVTRDDEGGFALGGDGGESDLYDQAVQVVVREKRASTSYVQRQLKIGYNRAADLIERMEKEGIVSSPNHAGKREVLA
jgi:S-DNA-T family DNA segregation ATPase FtsK/SpoIIIE